jgi:serine/threonine protein phosphatase PrpC
VFGLPVTTLVAAGLAVVFALVWVWSARRAKLANAPVSARATAGAPKTKSKTKSKAAKAKATATAKSTPPAPTSAETLDSEPRLVAPAKDKPAEAAPAVSAAAGAPALSFAADAGSNAALPKLTYEEDVELEPTKIGATERKRPSLSPPTQRIVYDEDAAIDEPTHSGALILVTATAQTDKGLRRKRNEDSVLAREDDGIFVVADGMGGYRGGEIASKLAIETIERAFQTKTFDGPEDDAIPRRASELARAIQMANEAIFDHAEADKKLEGMGTTICAARFSANKQRLYVGHVGDSRIYLYRNGKLRQMTTDHTMGDLGVTGAGSAHLSRAVGVWPVVPIDIVLGKPQPGDVYMLCSDGLTKMVDDEGIRSVLASSAAPSVVADALVKAANENGGKDNVSVIVVRVDDPATSDHPRVAA